jgi:hypothetical protein
MKDDQFWNLFVHSLYNLVTSFAGNLTISVLVEI